MKTAQPGLTLLFKQTGKTKHCMSVSIPGKIIPSNIFSLCTLRETQELEAQSTGTEILDSAL